MSDSPDSSPDLWARFRFSIVGPLLSAPPPAGELEGALEELARREWNHPTRPGECLRVARATIERWYYTARAARNPIAALRRTVREDAGRWKVLSERFLETLHAQYRAFPHWSVRLHHDNLATLLEADPTLGPLPSYPTLVRYMRAEGLRRQARRGNVPRPGLERARRALERREVRSFEVEHVGGLWHLDFHTSRHVAVLDAAATWVKPHLLAVLDDRSRLCCHAQFYFEENAETLVHAFSQALLKRGLPRALLTDNGGEMMAEEFVQGLEKLSIVHDTTLPYSPHQNGKQEHFWAVVEGRLLAMLENVADLTLQRLNEITQAWVELDYHRAVHSEIRTTPLERFLAGPEVLRAAPSPAALREAFRQRVVRRPRRSDATLTLEGVRFEIPSAYRHLPRVSVEYARWDLGFVHLVDERAGRTLCRIYPLDRARNATGERRLLEGALAPGPSPPPSPEGGLPPLLARLLAEYAASGLPPAYLPKEDPSKEER
jgi:transposase InsO family protein